MRNARILLNHVRATAVSASVLFNHSSMRGSRLPAPENRKIAVIEVTVLVRYRDEKDPATNYHNSGARD